MIGRWVYAALLATASIGFGLAFTVEPDAINMGLGALCCMALFGLIDLIERRWL